MNEIRVEDGWMIVEWSDEYVEDLKGKKWMN